MEIVSRRISCKTDIWQYCGFFDQKPKESLSQKVVKRIDHFHEEINSQDLPSIEN